jgi:pimeloyl-ACP methyl ester carboxylesterase
VFRRLPLLLVYAVLAGLVLRHEPKPATSAHASFGHGPAVVLVHGLGSQRAHWLPVARALARDHRVTLVDLPGHGVSAMPVPFSLDEARAALDRALDELGPGPVTLVGHSVGGLVCAAEALAEPDRVGALVLVETSLRPPMTDAEREGLLEALDRDYAGVIRAAYLDFGRDSLQGEALLHEVRALDPGMVKAWVRLAVTTDLSDAAATLAVPVTAVWAPRSWGPAERWADMAPVLGYARVPRLEVKRVNDAGHFVMLDQPDSLARIVAAAGSGGSAHAEAIAGR